MYQDKLVYWSMSFRIWQNLGIRRRCERKISRKRIIFYNFIDFWTNDSFIFFVSSSVYGWFKIIITIAPTNCTRTLCNERDLSKLIWHLLKRGRLGLFTSIQSAFFFFALHYEIQRVTLIRIIVETRRIFVTTNDRFSLTRPSGAKTRRTKLDD